MGKISLIGGAGFLGKRLATRLEKLNLNYSIFDINLNSKSNKLFYCDVEDENSLNKLQGFTCIINLAAIHKDNVIPSSRYYDVNVKGAINICNIARKFNINKIIFTSSVAIYGFAPDDTDERGKPNFFNEYGRTKYLAEEIFKKWQIEDSQKRSLTILRPTVIFGEENRGNVYNLFNQIASRRFIMFGNGKNKKSMCYVENVAAFIEHSLSFKEGIHIYNYIDKPDLDMNILVSKVRKELFGKDNVGIRLPAWFAFVIGFLADLISFLFKKPLPISKVRVKKFLSSTKFSSSLNDTNFKPPVKLIDGLKSTIRYEFFKDN